MQNQDTGIWEQFRKKKEGDKEHTTPPPKGFTLTEILNDRTKSHLFGELLKKGGQEDLSLRMAQGKLEAGDLDILAEERIKFVEKMAQAEALEALFTEETVVEVARSNPDFQKVVDLLGPKQAIKAMKGQLKELSVTDETWFESIAGPITTYHKKEEYQKIKDEVENFCKENNISLKEYLDALAIEDWDEKYEALRKLMKQTFGKWGKVKDFFTNGSLSRDVSQLTDMGTRLESALQDLETQKRDIGDVLFVSINDHEALRKAFSKELALESGSSAPAEQKRGFNEARLAAFDEARYKKDWEKHKKDNNYNNRSPKDQDRLKDSFTDQQIQKYEQAGDTESWWDYIFRLGTKDKIKARKSTLK